MRSNFLKIYLISFVHNLFLKEGINKNTQLLQSNILVVTYLIVIYLCNRKGKLSIM